MQINSTYASLVKKHGGDPYQFFTALDQVAKRLGLKMQWMAAVIYIESRFKPNAVNSKSGASGLIQFLDSSARGVGTTAASIRQMNHIQQLPYIEKYFKQIIKSVGHIPKDFFETYCIVFQPAWIGKPDNSQLSLLGAQQNSQADLNKDGKVTKGEFRIWANKQLPSEVLETLKKKSSIIAVIFLGLFIYYIINQRPGY